MTRSLSLALLLTLFFAASPATVRAQELKPSMNPNSGEDKNSFGFGGLGKERPKGAKTEITAKKQATFDNTTSIAEFEGNVVVKDVQFTLFCDRLKVTMAKDRKGLQLVEAFGDGRDKVIIVQENSDASGKTTKAIGRATKATYDPTTGIVTLYGWPSVQHDINLQQATEESTIMNLDRGGKMETKGGSKTVIVDAGDQKGQ
jgi:lipopolysaccharide transport protein LptA